ncbi:hypothetical protein Btru_052948 [Bulinus truncatus]|nr:hypothetical protein Btru_052948 [Bulinus truncatus]
MATAVSTSRPASATNRSLLPVPPRLPFPTHPAMPDRVSRLRRLNLAMSVRGGSEDEVAVDLDSSIVGSSVVSEGKNLDIISRMPENGVSAGYIRRIQGNSFVRNTRLSSSVSDSDGRTTNLAAVRRSHRNIVTPRRHQPPGQASTRRSKSRTGSKTHRLRLPSISVGSSEEPEQGIFLTSLIYEESPMPSDWQPSSSSSSTRSEAKRMSGDPAHDVSAPRDTGTSRDVVLPSLLNTSREAQQLTDRTTDLALSSVGLQRVYLEGVDHMRSHVTSVEEEADRIDREFHSCRPGVDLRGQFPQDCLGQRDLPYVPIFFFCGALSARLT